MTKVSGNTRGVPEPIASDFALIGDTRNPLHYKPLPHSELPYGRNSHAGPDPNMIRYDDGGGTGEGGEMKDY